MKQACLITIGNELLNGYTVDTNAAYLGRRLNELGLPLVGSFTVADEIARICQTLRLACQEAEVVLITGGLGPTDDDLTRQGLARFMGVELELDRVSLEAIQAFFRGRGAPMPDRNAIQAYFPKGACPIPNPVGTAPGILCMAESRMIAAMPGVPSEMEKMFEDQVAHHIRERISDQVVLCKRLHCFGAGESQLVDRLADMMHRGRNPQVNCTVDHGSVTLHIIASAPDAGQAGEMLARDEQFIRTRLGEWVYGQEGQTLAQVVGEALAERGRTLALAESCTGGLVAKLLTDVPGSSRYFIAAWVTYGNQAKVELLGVPAGLIEQHGAVSEQVAAAMAQGARKRAATDYAIAITGIAGPEGGTSDKPVGLVYCSLDSAQGCRTERRTFAGSRSSIRIRTAQTALNMLRLEMGL